MKSLQRLLLLLALVGIPFVSGRMDPQDYAGGRQRDAADKAMRNQSAIGVMLGEFRTSLSDLMFVKTERYLDGGVAYFPHAKEVLSVNETTQEMDAMQEEHGHEGHAHAEHGHKGHAHAEHGHMGEDYAGTPTVIPTAAADFRGWIGTLHRAVQPWRDPSLGHDHSDGTELLPWFRLMTLSDPHYVRGYAVGSWWLKRKNAEAAMQFVDEGIEHNPEAFEIHLMRGALLLSKARDQASDFTQPDPATLAILKEAGRSYQTAAQLGMQTRPAGYRDDGEPNPTWSEYQENDFLAACRMAVFTEDRYGNPAQAMLLANRYLSAIGDDGILQRFVEDRTR